MGVLPKQFPVHLRPITAANPRCILIFIKYFVLEYLLSLSAAITSSISYEMAVLGRKVGTFIKPHLALKHLYIVKDLCLLFL
jgi:hypothetical protein